MHSFQRDQLVWAIWGVKQPDGQVRDGVIPVKIAGYNFEHDVYYFVTDLSVDPALYQPWSWAKRGEVLFHTKEEAELLLALRKV